MKLPKQAIADVESIRNIVHELNVKTARIAELEAQLAEAVSVIKSLSPFRTWTEYSRAMRRRDEFLKKLEDTPRVKDSQSTSTDTVSVNQP